MPSPPRELLADTSAENGPGSHQGTRK